MIAEIVSPSHPDKIADRIAGALVDYCYTQNDRPRCAFEVLIGHGECRIIGETSVEIPMKFVKDKVREISGDDNLFVSYTQVPQDPKLARGQADKIVAGDNGIFLGHYIGESSNSNHRNMKMLARKIYEEYPYDGKIVSDGKNLTVCWSRTAKESIKQLLKILPYNLTVNPLGGWTGGVATDTGLTGRKLANDFYGIEAPLGGGNMHGKDLSKADVAVNIVCFLLAQEQRQDVTAMTSIGDDEVEFIGVKDYMVKVPYEAVVDKAHGYINSFGGFERFAEWGLI